MIFDVIKEPCIPVRLLTGDLYELSVREVFLKAHLIDSVYCSSVFEEYGLKRFLVVMFMDWMRPKDDDELKRILYEKKFNILDFDNYIELCNKRGDVFNLFSEEYPFYQTIPDESLGDRIEKKKGVKSYTKSSISRIFNDIPSKNNHTFFTNLKEEIDIKSSFRALLCLSLFLPASSGGAAGFTAGINGNPPYYFWIKGNNLFHEIILNSISINTWDACVKNLLPYAEDDKFEGVCWRRINPVLSNLSSDKSILPLTEASLLEGMTYFGRRVSLIDSNSSNIKEVIINPALKFDINNSVWKDPHCAFKSDKGKLSYIAPMEDEVFWILCSPLYDYSIDVKPLTFRKFADNIFNFYPNRDGLSDFDLDNLNLVVYGAYNPKSKGAFSWWKRNEIDISINIMSDKNLSSYYLKAINDIIIASKEIKSKLKSKISKEHYYNNVLKEFNFNFIPSLLDANIDNDILLEEFERKLIEYVKECYEHEFGKYKFSKLDIDSKFIASEIYFMDLKRINVKLLSEFGLEE